MDTTKISVTIDHMVRNEQKIKAYASVTLADAFKIHGIRVLDGNDGLYVTMPQRSYEKDGEVRYVDVFHPVTREVRNVLTEAVLAAYKRALE